MIDWTHIIIHHSASKDGTELDFAKFRQWHVIGQGWKDVGYHFGVERLGTGYEILGGRPWTLQGSHARGWNKKALGIVFAGNFNNSAPEERLIEVAVYRIIRPLCRTFDIGPMNILGHKDTGAKTDCPGHLFDVDRIRDLVS